jgi:hypothetical protein
VDDFDFDFDFDLSNIGDRRIGCGGRAVSGCFVIALPIVIFISILWFARHTREVVLGACVVAAIGVIYVARGSLLGLGQKPKRKDASALPTPLADVQPERLTHTAGLVGIHAEPHRTPLDAPPSVFYRVVIEHGGAIVFEGRSADVLMLEDGSGGKLAVHLDGAKWLVKRRHELTSSPSAPNTHVVTYLAERGIEVSGAVHAYVEWVTPHELVFVHGMTRAPARPVESDYRTSEAAPPLEMVSTPEHPIRIDLEPLSP